MRSKKFRINYKILFKFILKIIITIVAFVAFIISYKNYKKNAPIEKTFVFSYESRIVNSVKITDGANVRNEPIIIKNEFGTNSYGTANKGTVKVSKIFIKEDLDKTNGTWIGVEVAEATNNEGWKKIFPSSIQNDPDGIVWINSKLIQVNEIPR